MAILRVKRGDIWDSGVLVEDIRATFGIQYHFGVTLPSCWKDDS